MDYTNSLNSRRYVMSLDTLDLGLLPSVYTRLSNNSCTLWSANSLSKNSFFEFEVKPKTEASIISIDDTFSDSDTVAGHQYPQHHFNQSVQKPLQREDKEITTCHICDIEVPVAYLIDHEDSLKHKAYLKIMDAVLVRTRNHMLRKNNAYVQKNDAMYFCGPCASQVEVVNKQSHEKSKAHKQSISLDKLLYELVALYIDEDQDYEGASSVINNEAFDNSANDLKSNVNRHNDNETVVISDIRARLDDYETKTIENYIKIIDECDMDKSYSLSSVGNDLRISMQDIEVIVSMDNFNGFRRIDNNFILCLVCKMIVDNENRHKIGDTHIKNISTPFKDYHCLRDLDNTSSHCVICNKIVNNSDLHILCDETHIELLQKVMAFNETKFYKHNKTDSENMANKHVKTDTTLHNEFVNDSDHNSDYKLCNGSDGNRLLKSITVNETPSKTNEIKPNVNATNSNVDIVHLHNDIYHCPVCNLEMHVNNINTHSNGTKHAMNSKSNVHYFMKQDEGSSDFMCRVCNVYVEDDVDQVKEHVATNEHEFKYKDLLSTNYVIRQKRNFYCRPCDIVLLKMNELYHIEKLSHTTKLDHLKETMAGAHKVTEHINITETNSNDATLPENTPAYYCNICNVHIPNNFYNISGHNDGARHKKNVLKIDQDAADSVVSSDTGSPDVHYQMDSTENEKNLMCKICKVVVPNIENNIIEHISGKKHDQLLKGIIDFNHIECTGDKYFCHDCKLHVKKRNLFIHINQKRHKALLENLEANPKVSKTMETPDSGDKLNNDIITESIDELYTKFKHHFMELEDKKFLQCRVCFDMDIPNTSQDVANHTAKQTHITGYKDLITNNFIFETEDRGYFCAICECLVPLKGEVHHIKGMRHHSNYNTFKSVKVSCLTSSDYVTSILKKQSLLHYCEFCKMLIQKSKAEEHAHSCHKFGVKDKICFCTICDPYLPSSKGT